MSDALTDARGLLDRAADVTRELVAATEARDALGDAVSLEDAAALVVVHREQAAMGSAYALGIVLGKRMPALLAALCDEVERLRAAAVAVEKDGAK